jgi:hypothetical protein
MSFLFSKQFLSNNSSLISSLGYISELFSGQFLRATSSLSSDSQMFFSSGHLFSMLFPLVSSLHLGQAPTLQLSNAGVIKVAPHHSAHLTVDALYIFGKIQLSFSLALISRISVICTVFGKVELSLQSCVHFPNLKTAVAVRCLWMFWQNRALTEVCCTFSHGFPHARTPGNTDLRLFLPWRPRHKTCNTAFCALPSFHPSISCGPEP